MRCEGALLRPLLGEGATVTWMVSKSVFCGNNRASSNDYQMENSNMGTVPHRLWVSAATWRVCLARRGENVSNLPVQPGELVTNPRSHVGMPIAVSGADQSIPAVFEQVACEHGP